MCWFGAGVFFKCICYNSIAMNILPDKRDWLVIWSINWSIAYNVLVDQMIDGKIDIIDLTNEWLNR